MVHFWICFGAALVSAGTVSILAGEPPAPQKFYSHGFPIQFTLEGQGDPVLLIHGLTSSAKINWRAPGIIKHLAKRYQVIAMDVRGHGSSGKPEKTEDCGLELVEDVVRLLDHLHVRRAHVIGYSMGGMIAMKLMTTHPDRIRSVVLGGMGWLSEGSPLQGFWNQLPERQTAFAPAIVARSLGTLAITEKEVKSIRLPVSIVIGERDPVRELYVVPLQRARPDWPVTIVRDAGHMDCIFKAQFQKALSEWLNQQATSASGAHGASRAAQGLNKR